jgi:hypothetical protein
MLGNGVVDDLEYFGVIDAGLGKRCTYETIPDWIFIGK